MQGESRAKEDAKHFPFAMPSRSLPYLKVVQGESRAKEDAKHFPFAMPNRTEVAHAHRSIFLTHASYVIAFFPIFVFVKQEEIKKRLDCPLLYVTKRLIKALIRMKKQRSAPRSFLILQHSTFFT